MVSTSNRKSSSSDSRRSARGRVATPKGASKLTATPRSGSAPSGAPKAGAAAPKPTGGPSLGSALASGGPKAKRGRGLELPKQDRPSLGAKPRGSAAGGTRKDRGQDAGRPGAAAGSPRASRSSRGSQAVSGATIARRVAIAAGVVAALGVVALVALLVMSQLPVFVITGIDAVASEHVSAETIAKLASVDEGTTLLSVDVSAVSENVSKNPWVKTVNITREFPDKLAVSVEERSVAAIVVCGSGTSVWSLGDDGVWIEPTQLDTSISDDVTTQALAKAEEMGCLLITNVPVSVNPAQGSASTDDAIIDVLGYQQQLPEQITSQAQVYYAASSGSISVVLKSGLEVSLGAANDVSAKAQALLEIMGNYGDQLTYVNVRVPSKPTYRKVADGTALTGVESTVAQKLADEAAAAATSAASTASSKDGEGSDGSGEDGDDSYDDSYDDFYDDSYDEYDDSSYD